MKKSNDTIGNRTRDLPACSAMPSNTKNPCILPTQCVLYTVRVLQKKTKIAYARLQNCKKRRLASSRLFVRPSVRPHETNRLPLGGIS